MKPTGGQTGKGEGIGVAVFFTLFFLTGFFVGLLVAFLTLHDRHLLKHLSQHAQLIRTTAAALGYHHEIIVFDENGQTVFTTPINQQTSYIDLFTWTGNGIYFVQLIDPQNNTIENRKIVIQ